MKKKVVVSLQGGLGNQLHQYAYGLIIANKYNAELCFDVEFLNSHSKKLNVTYRGYEINKFLETPNFYKTILSNYFLLRVIKKVNVFNKILNLFKINVVSNYVPVHELSIKEMNLIYLHGIMGTYEDYKGNENYLKNKIKINPSFNHLMKEVENYVEYLESVSIHIRRTDYLKKGSIHHVLEMDYYNKAIDFIKTKFRNPKFYIFSDDFNFVQQNFDIDNDVFNYINYASDDSAFFDFLAIKECKHHILANSTFSWWATFLCTDNDGICIAPSVNLTTEILDQEKSYPSNWIVI